MSNFENNNYCDFLTGPSRAVAGKDLLLCVFNLTGDKLLAVAGQKSLTINRSADSIEITSKDTQGSWKSKLAGMKEWSIDTDGIYALGDESHTVLSKAFSESEFVCVKIINKKLKKGMFGGLATITDYPIEAPHDDSVTYSITLEGVGELHDLSLIEEEVDLMPEGTDALGTLTVVSVAGSGVSKDTMVYVNPAKSGGNKYFYKMGVAPLKAPTYLEVMSENEWNGTDAIANATTGQQIMIIETNSKKQAIKVGTAVITAKV